VTARARPDGGRADVVLCPGGPMLLRGEHVVLDDEGHEHRTTRPVTAVCRCHRSGSKPWCDGTHKLLPEKLRP
jgi:CDGSH-type Zn-finger protein